MSNGAVKVGQEVNNSSGAKLYCCSTPTMQVVCGDSWLREMISLEKGVCGLGQQTKVNSSGKLT